MVSASILKNLTIRHWPTAGPSCRGYGDPEVVYPSPITMAASNRRNSSKLVLRGIIHAETVYLIQLNTLIIDRHRRNEGEGSFWEVEGKQHGWCDHGETAFPKTATNKRNIDTPISSVSCLSTSIVISPHGLHCSRSLRKFPPFSIVVVSSRLLCDLLFLVFVSPA